MEAASINNIVKTFGCERKKWNKVEAGGEYEFKSSTSRWEAVEDTCVPLEII